jgi:DNA primase
MYKKEKPALASNGLVENSNSLNYTSSSANKQQISEMLADKIDAVLPALFPDKPIYRNGYEYRIGSNGSLVVTRRPDGVVFYSHESGDGGDALALIQYGLRCDFKSALAWGKGFIGLVEGQSLLKTIWKPEKRAPEPKCSKERISGALFLLNNSKPVLGTYAETYLRNRGITIPLPANLRFNVGIKNPSTGKFHPSLVAAVQDASDKFTAIHFISLNPFTCKKIEVSGVNAKISKGVIKGCAVRLSPADTNIVVCEGIEDGLSLLQLYPSLCVWAGLGGNIRNVKFPPEVTKVTIAADNDEAGKNNALKLYERLKNEGMDVSIIYPPEGFKDFNDYLLGGK